MSFLFVFHQSNKELVHFRHVTWDNLVRYGSWHNLLHCPEIFLGDYAKPQTPDQLSGRGLNSGLSEYEARAPAVRPRLSILYRRMKWQYMKSGPCIGEWGDSVWEVDRRMKWQYMKRGPCIGEWGDSVWEVYRTMKRQYMKRGPCIGEWGDSVWEVDRTMKWQYMRSGPCIGEWSDNIWEVDIV
jgi:hypothetical protein